MDMFFIRPLFTIFLFFCSCSSHPQLLPESMDLVDYSKALSKMTTDRPISCEVFSRLSKKNDFVLKDVAYVRSLQACTPSETTDWERAVPVWLEKEKQLVHFQFITSPLEKALFVQKNESFFSPPDRIENYQKGIADPTISKEQKQSLETSLFALAPRFMNNPSIKDQFKMVRDYRSVRNFDKARSLLKKIIQNKNASIEDQLNAHKELYQTSRLQKGHKTQAYIQATKNWAQFLKPKNLPTPWHIQSYIEAQTTYARVVWTEVGTDAALKIIDQIDKDLKGKTSLYEVYWLKARMLEEQKQHSLAVVELEKSLKEPISQWKDKEKILWTLAWSFFKEKKFPESEGYLQSLLENKDITPFSRFKYLYWRGEAEKRRGDSAAAKKTWQLVFDEDYFGYYSLIASLQLEQPLRNYATSTFHPSAYLSSDNEKIFYALKTVDEIDLATRLLSSQVSDINSLKTKSAADIANLFYLYSQIQNYKYIFAVFNQLPYPLQRDVFVLVPRLLFPEMYIAEMKEASEKTGMEPELIYSIMRQESSFDPEARSPMDAFGLLQILPEVAKRVAREMKIPYTNYEDLFDVKKNILIGAYLLKKQIQSFDNKFSLYVASYNASSSAVRGWYKRSLMAENDDIMFIEDIPYEETKSYVKLVMRNFIIYKKLKYGPDFKDFPRHLLEIKPSAGN